MKFLCLFLMFFSYFTAKASEIKINSIITLDKNIPKECGLNFFNKKKKFNLKVSIKKKNMVQQQAFTVIQTLK